MTFKATEAGGGKPAELYVFTRGASVWRYTSANDEIVVDAGPFIGTYIPVTISRSRFQQNEETTNNAVDVSIARSTAVAQLFQGDRFLAGTLGIQIARFNRLDTPRPELILQFSGEAAATATGESGTLLLHCTSEQAVFERSILKDRFQPLCNHFVFDSGCTLAAAAFKVTAAVAALSMRGTTLTIPDAALKPDGYYAFGYCVAPDGRPLAIIDHVGDQVTIIRPFPEGTIQPGSTSVDLYPGCDRKYETCHDKFNNVINFYAFDTIPEVDPWKTAMA
ncbi:MAG TPA: phage BR0599 family protein [Gemmatimonadaceae bacterium]|nr:phage BR0599 family protein [Gemmatimonadaceae bacterium]